MITYNGNFVSKIKYNGTELSSLKYAGTTVWKSQYCKVLNTSLTEINAISLSRTDTGWQGSFKYNVPLSFASSASWCSIVSPESYGVNSLINSPRDPTYRLSQFDLSCSVNTGAPRSAVITVKNTQTGDYLTEFSIQQGGWTTDSCTCTASPASFNTTYLNSTTTYTALVAISSYATETSSEGDSRMVAVTPTATISNSNIITGVSFTKVSGFAYTMTVSYKRNVIGSSTVTVTTSWGGKTDTATYTIRISQPAINKSMTLAFRGALIQSVYLFSGPATSNLSTNALESWVMSGDTDRLTISWTSTLSVNSPTGGSAQISEGEQFYVYYSASGASTIGQCTLSPTRPTLKDGATVQLA